MTRDPVIRRRRRNVVVAVLAVGILASALVALALFYMGQTFPGSR